ncbi:MAG TPA: DNA polymerase III subunit delta [Pyrinomonadaceae bacterium]|nr:DNA polymerase III subunit delta [Pyrinomonadaceae bacterium]
MPVRSRKELLQSLKQGKIEPVYFLFGPESYLRDQAARAIADEALRETLLREFNDSTFSLRTGDARGAIAAAEQLPMMSPRRVVQIKDFSKLNETTEEILLRYIDRPVETSVVIFNTDDVDKRKKFAKKLMSGAAFEFAPLNNAELSAWARTHLAELKADAAPAVVSRIVELVGSNVRSLANELNKLATAALPSANITLDLVEELVGRSRELMNWELTDHMLSRNRARAVKTLQHLLDDGAPPVMLIGLIASTYRRMALAHALLSKGAPPKEIFRQVPMPPFKQSSYLQMLNRVDGRRIAQQMVRIAEADLGIKTSKATPRMQVELLVNELMN